MQQHNNAGNSSPVPRRRTVSSDGSTSTTTYTASGSDTKPYVGSSGSNSSSSNSNSNSSYSYSYSYTGSQSGTGTENTSPSPRDNKQKSGAAPQLLSMLQRQKEQRQQLLPPRAPRLALGNVSSGEGYQSPPKESKEGVSKSVSTSSGSYGDSGSYSYSYSYTEEEEGTEEEEDEEDYTGSNSSYSYSYSYSDEPTDPTGDTVPPNKGNKGKREEVSSVTVSSYSGQDSATTGESSSGSYTTESYTGSTGDSSGSGSYTGSYSVTDSSDGYSYSYSYSTSGPTVSGTGSTATTTTSGTRSSEFTTDSSSGTGQGYTDSITRSTGEDSYSYSYYSYSYSGKDTTSSGPHRYSSTLTTESEDSEMSLTASDTRTGSGSSSSYSKSHRLHKDLPPLYPDIRSSKALTTSTSTSTGTTTTATATPSTTTTSLIRDDGSSWHSYSDEISRSGSTTVATTSTGRSSRSSTAIGATESVQVREVLTLCAPSEEAPRIRALPHTCLIPYGSVNDTVAQFVDRLSDVQIDVLRKEAQEKAAAAAAAEEGKKEKSKSKKKKESVKVKTSSGKEEIQEKEEKNKPLVISTDVPAGCFIKKSVKFALKAVGVETTEERALILKSLTLPLQHDALLTLLNNQAHQCLFQRIRSMFCAHDRFMSGEVSLNVTLDIFRRCGIAHRNVGDFTLSLHSLSPKARYPMVCVTQRSLLTNPTTNTTPNGENTPPLESQINEVTLDVCSSALRAGGVNVCWDEEGGDLYVGNLPVIKMVGTPRSTARYILQQLEAMIHVCLSVEACTVNDPTSLSHVLYTPLLTALFSSPPSAFPNAKSVIVENALATLLKPIQQLERLATHHRIQERYLGSGEDTLLRDTIPNRQEDMALLIMQEEQYQEKQQYAQHGIVDWMPKIAASGDKFETISAQTVNDVHYDVSLKKLRIAEAVPADARCYCLVSARKKSSGEWMRAVVVPVVSVKPSKKGGFKWTFGENETDRIFFAGSKTDTLYIEACYDVSDGVTREGGIGGEEILTWCAGHAVIVCSSAKSGTFSVMHGSLIPDNNNDNNNNNNNNTATESKLVEPSKGFFCCFRRKQNAAAAKSLTIAIRSLRANSLSPRESLPSRCLALRRHVPLMAQMRDAIVNASFDHKNNNNDNNNSKNKNKSKSKNDVNTTALQPPPLHVLRQQQVQCCFTVAAHTVLMDVLATLWDRTLRGKMGAKPKNTEQKQKALLTLASKIAAVHNNIGEEQDAIVNIVARGASIPGPLNSQQAPQRPIYV
ncbi:uncharacterized protein TM35_000191140 [Trypanosoma theileri]|uniref:Uncharacterized protein n=1 Tax=Trypanosoma theileri TaxID=67003 RepID=A0A1X0NUT4_9TRYP|nr:uncharacterized protein TM35_000191140 [Trypanosoma theileri]ORC87870.1 hypothetical protein TM35_000191140 [Trypanosoma theileri]